MLTIFIICFLGSAVSQLCNNWNEKPLFYKLAQTNSYSKQTVLSRKRVPDVEKCKEFAEEKRALAFNYGYYTFLNDSLISDNDDPFNVNCIVLMCPEINNFTALAKVRGFDYYSVYYNKIWLGGNRTLSCIPSVGLFMISDDTHNFTEARISCLNLNGSLAHIASEVRTNYLASLIGNYSSVYIGLSSDKEKREWKNECNEPLSCFNYRAWGEGQPTRSHGCATLTRTGTNSIPYWQAVSCRQKLKYICEIAPEYRQLNMTGENKVMPNCKQSNKNGPWEFFRKTPRQKLT